MSLLRGEKNRDYFSRVTHEFKKFSSYIRGFSSQSRREKKKSDKRDNDEISPGPPQRRVWGLGSAPKTASLSPRSKLAEGNNRSSDKKTSTSFQIQSEKQLKPIVPNSAQKSSPREGLKLGFKVQNKDKRSTSTSAADEETPRRLVPIPQQQQQVQQLQQQQPVSYAEVFLSRYAKLQNFSVLTNPEPVHCSVRPHGPIKGFAVCTNQGLVRSYNEDRVSITLGAVKPAGKQNVENWPSVNIFGVMDGHGGAKCAEFLRDNFHQYILKSKHFPKDPEEALKEACSEADRDFLELALNEGEGEDRKHDRSGSCAVILVTVDDKFYFCNVGDSRAILSQNFGAETIAMTRDHKPNDMDEIKRIEEAGGAVYQNQAAANSKKKLDADSPFNIPVPFRISPGRLSVSRAFGDIEAKFPKFGGNPKVLISKPDVSKLEINGDCDFLVLGCDGIYDTLTNEEITETVWNSLNSKKAPNLHELLKIAVQDLIKEALLKKSLDNVTALIISLNSLDYKFNRPAEVSSAKSNRARKPEVSTPKWDYFSQEDVKNTANPQYRRVSKKLSIKTGDNPNDKSNSANENTYQSARVKNTINNYGFDSNYASAKLQDMARDMPRRSSGSLPKIVTSKTPR